MWNLLGKITSGFFINMGKSIGSITKQLSPYVNTVSKSIVQFSKYIISHFPKSPSQFKGLRSVINKGLQFIDGTLYHLPVRHRGLTLLFVAFVGALHVARAVQMVVYPARQYDANKLFTPDEKKKTNKTLANFVYVAREHIRLVHNDNTIRTRIRRIAKHNSTHSPHPIKLVHYTLTNTQCEEAILWSQRCRRNTDNKHLHKGLLISNKYDNSAKWKRLTEVLGASKNADGILFTHDSTLTHDSKLKHSLKNKTSYNIESWPRSARLSLEEQRLQTLRNVLNKYRDGAENDSRATLWIIHKDSLYDHQPSDTTLLQHVGHIHFLEPTDYSLKQIVYSLCEYANTPHTKFNRLLPELDFGTTKFSIGYESTVQLQIYEYVSRFPHWTSDILSIFPSKHKSVKQVVNEHRLYTPDQIALAQYTTIQDDVRQLQNMYSDKLHSHESGATLQLKELRKKPIKVGDFRDTFTKYKKHYEKCILGELKHVKELTEKEQLERALMNAENEKQNMLIGRLRKEMQETLFKNMKSDTEADP